MAFRLTSRTKLWTLWRTFQPTRCYGTRQESKPWRQRPNRDVSLSVILLQDVHKLGVKGQIVKVKRGYGRNCLLPKGMAAYVTPDNVKKYNAFTIDESTSSVNELDILTDYLSSKILHVEHDPDSKSAVYEQHISRAFRKDLQLHVPIDCIELQEPITDFDSEHTVEVKVDESTQVTVPLKIEMVHSKRKRRILEKKKAKEAAPQSK